MWYRLHQFWSALWAGITTEDKLFIETHLTPSEAQLFLRLNKSTQKHSIKVAQAAVQAVEGSFDKESLGTLIKAALLHDIGKTMANLNIINKTLYVLIKSFCPHLLSNLKLDSPIGIFRNLAETMYIAENHAQIGATLAREHGIDQVIVDIIAAHHQDSANPIAMAIRQADELN